LEDDDKETGAKPEARKAVEKPAAAGAGVPAQPGYTPGSIPYPPGHGPAPAAVTYYQPYYVTDPNAKPKRSSKPSVAGGLLIITGFVSIIMGIVAMTVMVGFMGGDFPMGGPSSGTGEINGQVIFQNMTPAENVSITVVETGQLATTNATGNYRIIGVTAGTHQLKVEFPNYKTVLQKVTVKSFTGMDPGHTPSTDVTRVDFQLTPGDGSITIGSGSTSEDWGLGFAKQMVSVCSVLWILLGILIIVGGYFSLQRQRYGVAIIGGVAGLLTPLCILSMIALVVLFLSGEEFRKEKESDGPAPVRESGLHMPPGSKRE